MQEEVDYNGKPKGTDSFSWRPRSTRVAYMVDEHLHYSIERAMKDATHGGTKQFLAFLRQCRTKVP